MARIPLSRAATRGSLFVVLGARGRVIAVERSLNQPEILKLKKKLNELLLWFSALGVIKLRIPLLRPAANSSLGNL